LNILFITHTRIGDGVLSSGILHQLAERYPDARFTIACGPLAASLFADTPRLDRVIIVAKQRFDAHWYALWKEVRGTVWDIVVDLRRSLISYVIPVRKRYVVGAIPDGVHHVVHLSRLLGLAEPAAPFLYRSARHNAAGAVLIPDGAPVLAIAPVAATQAKTWAPQRFADLIARLTGAGGLCAGWRVALFGGPGDEINAAPLIAALAAQNCIKVFAEPDLLTVQAALARCRAFIGNDSGLAHLAAAAGLPTLALFGASDPVRYRPWGGTAVQAPGQDFSTLDVETVAQAFAGQPLRRL
jgi:heptosyltransferase III